jgi:precorrin-6Y C5,15-methyltransferase (decarboxylating)
MEQSIISGEMRPAVSPMGSAGDREFVIIGLTDNRSPWFPPEVVSEIKSSRVFSGGRRHHEIVAAMLPQDAEWIDITVPIDAVFGIYENYRERIVVFASGDPLFFGFANTVRRKLPFVPIRLYPAFNSLQTLAHRMVIPYHDMRVVSLTGRPWHGFDRALIECCPLIGILTDRERTPAAIARRMMDFGYDNYLMTVGENLGNAERERITTQTVGEAAEREFSSPNCMILTATYRRERRFGIPDTEFDHLPGRSRMITKMPIRLLALQALGLPSRSVLWDIGFCTGSVSIEAKMQFPHLEVVSFEVRSEGKALIEANSRRFGIPGIKTVIGDFLDADLSVLPRPDAVFIGGHGGRLSEIMARVADLLPDAGSRCPDGLRTMAHGGVIVMNSVSEDSRKAFEAAARELGLTFRPVAHVALDDYNPIDILKAEKS